MWVNPKYRGQSRAPTPPAENGHRLATFPRAEASSLRVCLAEYQGKPFVSLRVWEHARPANGGPARAAVAPSRQARPGGSPTPSSTPWPSPGTRARGGRGGGDWREAGLTRAEGGEGVRREFGGYEPLPAPMARGAPLVDNPVVGNVSVRAGETMRDRVSGEAEPGGLLAASPGPWVNRLLAYLSGPGHHRVRRRPG